VTHVRKTIRDAAATAVTGLATTSTRVYKSRNLPLQAAEFPSLCVYARADEASYESSAFVGGVPRPTRRVELHVEGYQKDADGAAIEDTLDAIAEEVETAIFGAFAAAPYWACHYGGATTETNAESEETLATIDLVFFISYRAADGAPGVIV